MLRDFITPLRLAGGGTLRKYSFLEFSTWYFWAVADHRELEVLDVKLRMNHGGRTGPWTCSVFRVGVQGRVL